MGCDIRHKIMALIGEELKLQDNKWGTNRVRDSRTWLVIIGEEFGEACRASLEHDPDSYRDELVDVAASAIAALQSLELELNKDKGA